MSPPRQDPQLGHIIFHFHAGCLHPYQDTDFSAVELNNHYTAQDDQGRSVLLVLDPRWCPTCAKRRGDAIYVRYEHRLRGLEASAGHCETIRKEVAYVRGIRDGRMKAQSMSLTRLKEMYDKKILEGSEEEDELMEMMEEMEVGPRTPGPIEQEEELAEMMRKGNLGPANALRGIIDGCCEEYRVYKAGLEEGMVEQGGKEFAGIMERNLGRRVEVLEMALA